MEDHSRTHATVRPSDRSLQYGAATLTYVVAGLHLFHPDYGFAQLIVRLSMGPSVLLADPRPVAFVLSGLALLAGVVAVLAGVPKKPVYALGIVLMNTYIVGYFAWHFSGHGGFLPGREPLHHGTPAHESVLRHLTGDVWAAGAIVTEIALLALLSALYWRTR